MQGSLDSPPIVIRQSRLGFALMTPLFLTLAGYSLWMEMTGEWALWGAFLTIPLFGALLYGCGLTLFRPGTLRISPDGIALKEPLNGASRRWDEISGLALNADKDALGVEAVGRETVWIDSAYMQPRRLANLMVEAHAKWGAGNPLRMPERPPRISYGPLLLSGAFAFASFVAGARVATTGRLWPWAAWLSDVPVNWDQPFHDRWPWSFAAEVTFAALVFVIMIGIRQPKTPRRVGFLGWLILYPLIIIVMGALLELVLNSFLMALRLIQPTHAQLAAARLWAHSVGRPIVWMFFGSLFIYVVWHSWRSEMQRNNGKRRST